MSVLQDRVNDDLKRFMYDEMPDNVEELRAEIRECLIAGDSTAKTRSDKDAGKVPLFSDSVNRELAKHRPSDVQKKRGLAVFGLAFSLLAIFSMVMLPEPLNWVMASGCLIPFVGPLIKHKIVNRNVRRSQTTQ